MTSRPPLLHIENLSVTLGANRILQDISLCVEEREIIAIIGPNGAGKTTLLKTLLGFITECQGRLELMGKPMKVYPARERARWMAYVPQSHDFAGFSTVEEFVGMGRYPYISAFRTPTQEDQQIVSSALAMTGTAHLAARTLETLSGGEQQKVLIAAALAQQPKILLLDEPATFLDPKNQVAIHQLLCQINRETGTTILAITHDINSALQGSRRIVALKGGRIVFNGKPQELASDAMLATVYDTPFRLLADGWQDLPLALPDLNAKIHQDNENNLP